jgi:hypothetical protein
MAARIRGAKDGDLDAFWANLSDASLPRSGQHQSRYLLHTFLYRPASPAIKHSHLTGR